MCEIKFKTDNAILALLLKQQEIEEVKEEVGLVPKGDEYETHAGEFFTTDDLITLRDKAVDGLEPGELTGLVAKNYDGINDGQLGFDADGNARVGDVGSTQVIATREDSPLSNGIAYYDNTTREFKTKTESSLSAGQADNANELGGISASNYARTDVNESFNGNVGIGVENPNYYGYDAKLHIKGSGATTTDRTGLILQNSANTGAASLAVVNGSNDAAFFQVTGRGYYGGAQAAFFTKDLDISFGTNGQNTETGGTNDITFGAGGWSLSNYFVRFSHLHHVNIFKNNSKLTFGASNNASIRYDGSDMVFNSREAGTGDFVFDEGLIKTLSHGTAANWKAAHDYAVADNAGKLGGIVAANYYHSGNANKSDVDWTVKDLSVAGSITALGGNSSQWNTAYSWGNHSGLYSLLNHGHAIADVTGLQTALNGKVDDSQVLTNVPAGAVFTDTVYTLPFTNNSANWNTAYGWGDHSFEGYLKSADLSGYATLVGDNTWGNGQYIMGNMPSIGVSSDSPSFRLGSPFNSPTRGQQYSTWELRTKTSRELIFAFNDSYFDGSTYNDKIKFSPSGDIDITGKFKINGVELNLSGPDLTNYYHQGNFTDNSSNWNTAYGWGNHASAGYASSGHSHSWSQVSGVGRNESSVSRILFPGGGTYNSSNSSVTGAIKIQLPGANTSTMMKMRVEIFDYALNESVTLIISGYAYSNLNWINESVQILASSTSKDYTVRFGNQSSKQCIWIGEISSTWSYPKVTISELQTGHSNNGVSTWDDGWVISMTTAFGTVEDTLSDNLVASDWNKIDNKPGTFTPSPHTHSYLPLSGGILTGHTTLSQNQYIQFAPNSSWSGELRIGGNGHTISSTKGASIVSTDGNLHMDAAPAKSMYLNFYSGTGGINFGDGNTGIAASVSAAGVYTALGGNSNEWNTAYGWGDHASAGYASGSHTHSNIESKGIGDVKTGRSVFDDGVHTYNVHSGNANKPSGISYGASVVWGRGTGGSAELMAGWTSGDQNHLYYRSLRDTTDNWWSWKRIYHTGYKPSPADIGAVARSGDEMTDWLTVRTEDNTPIPIRAYRTGGTPTSGTAARAILYGMDVGESGSIGYIYDADNASKTHILINHTKGGDGIEFYESDKHIILPGDIYFNSDANIHRNSHSSGFLVGSYNSVGSNSSKTNPIYTIGSSYQPTDTSLSNMYGIGYTHTDAGFITGNLDTGGSGWGMYVASDGDARIWLNGGNGTISTTGSHYAGGLKLATESYVTSRGYVTSSGNTVIGTNSDINTSGSTIIDNIYVTDGVITSMGTRTLTAGDIGAAPASHSHSYMSTSGTSSSVNFTGNFSIDGYRLDGSNRSATGWCYLPGGMKMNWGKIYMSGNSSKTVSFNSGFGTTAYSVTVTPNTTTTGNMDGWNVNNVSSTSFKLTNGHGSNIYYYWTAIGRQ
ncbi:hypothetical protein L3073_00120 [Ancylomarina sp. DW003]|nr:hypothetical protein [Ancylomarina sp. DW003]MDE5420607.1 hypothetical protein [Ancylomarina sp. DW003]